MGKSKFIRFTAFCVSLVLGVVACFGVLNANRSPAYAYTELNYEQAGINFLLSQYNENNIVYDTVEKFDSINLYDQDLNVIAKLLILDRDGEYDYAVLDFITDRVDEFGFGQWEFLSKFYNSDIIYYSGAMSYAYFDDGKLYNIDGNQINEGEFFSSIDTFYELTSSIPKASIYDGIMSFYDIIDVSIPNKAGVVGDITTVSSKYIEGFNWLDSNYDFASQSEFNAYYNNKHGTNIDGTCAVVALTDISVYFDALGYHNALLNGNKHDTFERILSCINWFDWDSYNTNEQWFNDVFIGYNNYLTSCGYKTLSDHYIGSTFRDFEISINNQRPIWTYICYKDNSRTEAHAVVTVGYEVFNNTYSVNEKYWMFGWHDNWKTYSTDYYYLRVIDGWGTSNKARFVDYNQYYSVVSGIDFSVYKG